MKRTDGPWVCDATCSVCEARYSAWMGPCADGYGARQYDLESVREHGFYDLSWRTTFNDEPGHTDRPQTNVEVFRVVIIDGRERHREPME